MSNSGDETYVYRLHEKWLPSGWVAQVREKPGGRRDKYYFSPNGIGFNSKVKVCHYLETGKIGVACRKRRSQTSNFVRVARKKELEKSMKWLPPAWKVESRERKDGNTYKIYIDPVTGRRFQSTVEVSRYIQTGELPRRNARKKIANDVDSTHQAQSPSSMDKVQKLAWNSKRRRSLFTGQSSNTTSMKNNELVLISADVQCWEGVECCDDRHFLLLPSNVDDWKSRHNPTAYTNVICAIPLSVYYPDNQVGIAQCGKRKPKSRSAKSQGKKEPVNKRRKPNPHFPKERILPSRTSRRLAGLEPEFSPETSNKCQDVSMEASTEVETVPVGTEEGDNDLEENVNNLESGKSEYEIRLELVPKTTSGNHDFPLAPSPEVGNQDFPEDTVAEADDGESANPLGIEEKINAVGKTHAEEGNHALEENTGKLESETISCAGAKPSLLEGQETMTCIKKEIKYIDGPKGKSNDGRGQAFRVVQRRFKVNVSDEYEKPSIPDHMEAIIKRLGGRYIEWMADKEITRTDVNKSQACLYLPIKFENFLSETEQNYLKEKPKNGLEVVVVDHKSETWGMLVKYWPSAKDYILMKNWPKMVKVNGIKAGEHVVEIWTFRQCLSQEEEVEDGNKKKGRLGLALNFRRWELLGASVASTSNGDYAGVTGSSGDIDSVSCADVLDSEMDGSADLCSAATNSSDVVTIVDIVCTTSVEGEDMHSLGIGVKQSELGIIPKDEGVQSVKVKKRTLESERSKFLREPELASVMTKSNQDAMTSAQGDTREGRHSLGIEGKVNEVRFKPQLGPERSNRTPDVPVEASLQFNTGACFHYLDISEQPNELQKPEMEKRFELAREPELASEVTRSNYDVPVNTGADGRTREGRHSLGIDGKVNEVQFKLELAPEMLNHGVPGEVNIHYLGIDEQSNEVGKTHKEKIGQLEENMKKLETEKCESVMRPEVVSEARSCNKDISVEANTKTDNGEGTHSLCIKKLPYRVGKTHEERGDQCLENNTRTCEYGSSEYAMKPELAPDMKIANNDTSHMRIAENDAPLESSNLVHTEEATCSLGTTHEEENVKKPESEKSEFEMEPELALETTRGNQDVASRNRSGKSNVLRVAQDRLLVRSLETLDWLPLGWEVEFRERKNGMGGDKYYIDPASGYKFRSRTDVSRYLENGVFPAKSGRRRSAREAELSGQVVLGLECRDRSDVPNSNGNYKVAKLDTGEAGIEMLGKTPHDKGNQFREENTRNLEHGRSEMGREYECDPWKTHAEEYTRKLQSKKVGTVIRLPFRESALDPCVEFACKTLAGLIPIEHLPLNLVHEW